MSRDGGEREGRTGERKKRRGGRDGKAGGMEGIKMWFHYRWCVHLSSSRDRLCSLWCRADLGEVSGRP